MNEEKKENIKHLLAPLFDLKHEDYTDIVVNPNGSSFAFKTNGEKEELPNNFISVENLNSVAYLLSGLGENNIDESNPGVSAKIDDPFPMRLEIVLPPVVDEPTMCVRFYRYSKITLEDLGAMGFFKGFKKLGRKSKVSDVSNRLVFFNNMKLDLKEAVKKKKNILVCGATGSGKTTLANALINEIPLNERLLIVEDLREIVAEHKDKVSMLTTDYFNGSGAIKKAMRLRPDRIIYGEVRDEAAYDLLDGWATGHNGGIGTIHSSSAEEALERIARLASRKSSNISLEACKDLAFTAVDVIIFVAMINGKRQVVNIQSKELKKKDYSY